jgi:hypothetical protein
MVRASRYAYAALAWAFLVGLLVQVFLIGLGLFDDAELRKTHASFGWMLHLSPILILPFAYLSRAGREHWLWAIALVVVVFLVPILAVLRDSSPVLAALHPVGAVIAFAVACVVAWNSLRAIRMRDDPAHGTRNSAL